MDTITVKRPAAVITAVVILSILLIIGLVAGLLRVTDSTIASTVSAKVNDIGLFIGTCIAGWFVYKIYRGRNWARIVYLILFILGTLSSFHDFVRLLHESVNLDVVVLFVYMLMGFVAQIVALVLLFSGPGSRWFRSTKTQSQLPG